MNFGSVAWLAFIVDVIFGTELRNELFRSLRIVVIGGTRWSRHWVAIPVTIWTLGLYALAANGFGTTPRFIVWLAPAVILAVVAISWPTVAAAIAVIYNDPAKRGYDAVIAGMRAIGWVMFAGLSLVVIPADRDPFVVAMVAGLILFVALWNAGGTSVWAARIKSWGTGLAIVAIFALLISLFLGGRDAVIERVKGSVSVIATPKLTQKNVAPIIPAVEPARLDLRCGGTYFPAGDFHGTIPATSGCEVWVVVAPPTAPAGHVTCWREKRLGVSLEVAPAAGSSWRTEWQEVDPSSLVVPPQRTGIYAVGWRNATQQPTSVGCAFARQSAARSIVPSILAPQAPPTVASFVLECGNMLDKRLDSIRGRVALQVPEGCWTNEVRRPTITGPDGQKSWADKFATRILQGQPVLQVRVYEDGSMSEPFLDEAGITTNASGQFVIGRRFQAPAGSGGVILHLVVG